MKNRSKAAQRLHLTDFEFSKKMEKRILKEHGLTREDAVKRAREDHLNLNELFNFLYEFC